MDGAANLIQFISYSGVVTSLIVLAITWFFVQLLMRFITRFGERFSDRRLLIKQFGTLVRFVIYVGAISVAVLLSFKLTDQMLLALGGTIAVTLGIAFKDLAASVIAGIIILIDKPFNVGDRVTFGNYYGEIVDIGLWTVRLVTLDDNRVTIPNSKFLTDAVASGNAGALDMLIQMDFHIGADQPVERAKALVGAALTSCRYAFLGKPWRVIVNQVIQNGYFAIRLRAQVYVLDVAYEKALETDVTERVLEAFRAAGIQPPAMLHRHLPPTGAAPPELLVASVADPPSEREAEEVSEVAPV